MIKLPWGQKQLFWFFTAPQPDWRRDLWWEKIPSLLWDRVKAWEQMDRQSHPSLPTMVSSPSSHQQDVQALSDVMEKWGRFLLLLQNKVWVRMKTWCCNNPTFHPPHFPGKLLDTRLDTDGNPKFPPWQMQRYKPEEENNEFNRFPATPREWDGPLLTAGSQTIRIPRGLQRLPMIPPSPAFSHLWGKLALNSTCTLKLPSQTVILLLSPARKRTLKRKKSQDLVQAWVETLAWLLKSSIAPHYYTYTQSSLN